MVVDELSDEAVDRLFHALSDATRRDILRRAVRGDLSVSRLAEAYPMSFAAVQKHIAVLERAGLVTKERRGREQIVHTDPDAVRSARQVLDRLEEMWRGRVDRMSDVLTCGPTAPTGRAGSDGPAGAVDRVDPAGSAGSEGSEAAERAKGTVGSADSIGSGAQWARKARNRR